MTNKVVLEFKGISKSFPNKNGSLQVLKDFSLTIRKGEIVALVGPSGCGKTTLLNIAAGLVERDSGELVLDREKRLAYVFQEPRLLPWKTVDENIWFVQEQFLEAENARLLRNRLLEKAELSAFRNAYPAALSGGMKQRVELIRALSVEPEVLLMDEPFKSLDVALRTQLWDLLLEEHERQGFTMLFSTHDPGEAMILADRVVILTDKPARIMHEVVMDEPRDRRLQQFDVALSPINSDTLPIFDPFYSIHYSHNGRKAVFPRND